MSGEGLGHHMVEEHEVLEMEMATCVECGRDFLRFAGFESNGKCAGCTYAEAEEADER